MPWRARNSSSLAFEIRPSVAKPMTMSTPNKHRDNSDTGTPGRISVPWETNPSATSDPVRNVRNMPERAKASL